MDDGTSGDEGSEESDDGSDDSSENEKEADDHNAGAESEDAVESNTGRRGDKTSADSNEDPRHSGTEQHCGVVVREDQREAARSTPSDTCEASFHQRTTRGTIHRPQKHSRQANKRFRSTNGIDTEST